MTSQANEQILVDHFPVTHVRRHSYAGDGDGGASGTTGASEEARRRNDILMTRSRVVYYDLSSWQKLSWVSGVKCVTSTWFVARNAFRYEGDDRMCK